MKKKKREKEEHLIKKCCWPHCESSQIVSVLEAGLLTWATLKYCSPPETPANTETMREYKDVPKKGETEGVRVADLNHRFAPAGTALLQQCSDRNISPQRTS